jgi:hypothetical protein
MTPNRASNHAHISVAAAMVFFAMAGCAGAGAPSSSGTRTWTTVITQGEINEARSYGVRDMYDLVQRFRPRWLMARPVGLKTEVLVYQDTHRMGGLEVLRGFQLDGVTSVYYLDFVEASVLGDRRGQSTAAIVISTATRPATFRH